MEEKTVRAKVQEQRGRSLKYMRKSWQIKAACTWKKKRKTLTHSVKTKQKHDGTSSAGDVFGERGWGLSSMTVTDSDTITHGHVLLYTVVVSDTYRFTQELAV